MQASERQGQSPAQLNPLACALANALRSSNTASAWTHLRDVVCTQVRLMRDAGESKASVLNTITAFARESIHTELGDSKVERVGEELLAEVSLWCIDEYDGERLPAAIASARRSQRRPAATRRA